MRLNYKRVIFVGFAFFLICAFWQAYDAIVPLILVNKFGMSQFWSGVIMSLDNVLAVFMLPLFGTLSDKTKTKYGKRTPYIVLGTLVAVMAFIGLTFADNAQLARLNSQFENAGSEQQIYLDENYEISNAEYSFFTNKDVAETYKVKDYCAKIYYNKNFNQLDADEQNEVCQWFLSLEGDSAYYEFNNTTDTYLLLESADDADGANSVYSSVLLQARNKYSWQTTLENPTPLIVFIVVLLVVLVAMATFRSPAVALMPDVTVKPLRSRANAIINLMGTIGAALMLFLGILFGTGKATKLIMSYTGYVCAVCAVILVALVLFVWRVREPAWSREMLEESDRLGLDKEEADADKAFSPESDAIKSNKLVGTKLISLLLILVSVALWYTGYNAVTSKFSLYAVNVLNMDYNSTLMLSLAAACVAYIPMGFLATKIGRKRSILLGVALLTASFFAASFIRPSTPSFVLNLFFVLAGIAWAAINVNSFPMVVELSNSSNVGKFTGYYYTASMSAQIITPVLSGAIMTYVTGSMKALFPYATIFVALSFVTMLFVRHGDSKKIDAKKSDKDEYSSAD